MPKLSGRILPAKDKSIAVAAFQGAGRETEYRIEGNPGLVLAVMAPGAHGTLTRVWRAYYGASTAGRRTIRKMRIGAYPKITLAEARRKAAEIMEAVERGGDPVGEHKAKAVAAALSQATFADLLTDYITDRQATKSIGQIER